VRKERKKDETIIASVPRYTPIHRNVDIYILLEDETSNKANGGEETSCAAADPERTRGLG
jgi:hypothetical protein